jgi:hypothetical protein
MIAIAIINEIYLSSYLIKRREWNFEISDYCEFQITNQAISKSKSKT